jgi:FtsZ-interacting cell division protein YlmF
MSEYQYYEFAAVDRPLTDREMRTLRRYSTRAAISPMRFVNSYSWGDFKGNPAQWVEKYFDAFLYFANWGTRKLMLRLPRNVLELETIRRYMQSDIAEVKAKEDVVILTFLSEVEPGWVEAGEDSEWMESIIPVREQLAEGDLRALYLAWLLSAQMGELDESTPEPPVPAGLDHLDASLEAFASFFDIDADLIAAAAEKSPRTASDADTRQALGQWVQALTETEKTELLVRVVAEDSPGVRHDLRRRFRRSQPKPAAAAAKPRTVSELLTAAEHRAEEQSRKEAERKARERAKRERKEAAARARYLDELAPREAAVWKHVRNLIATYKPAAYDEAAKLLTDLKDLGARSGREAEVEKRIRRIRTEHARKRSFIRRLEKLN